jgi:hypothetical protein
MPPAIFIAIASFVVLGCARIAAAGPLVTWWALLAGAIGTGGLALMLAGMLHLRQRVAAAGFALMLAIRLLSIAVTVDPEWWRNELLREALAYGSLGAHVIVMVSLAVAVWQKRPVLAICAVASAFIAAPPPPLAQIIYDAVVSNFRQFYAVELIVRMPQYVMLLLLSLELARPPEPRPALVADGLRHGYRAMCAFSAVAALVAIGALRDSLWLPALEAVALSWFAYGVLRSARAPLHPWLTTLAAMAVLVAAGLLLTSLPSLYRHDRIPNLGAPVAVLCIAAAGLMTRALTNIVDKMQLQAKGIGSIVMFTTAFSIVVFLVPQGQTPGSLIALRVLGGFVMALGAWMLSWLCRLGAERLERNDPELPTARVV